LSTLLATSLLIKFGALRLSQNSFLRGNSTGTFSWVAQTVPFKFKKSVTNMAFSRTFEVGTMSPLLNSSEEKQPEHFLGCTNQPTNQPYLLNLKKISNKYGFLANFCGGNYTNAT
jgi:hypothetical protein